MSEDVKKVEIVPADCSPITRGELGKYLRENLRLEVKSERVRPDDSSVYKYVITLKLEGSPVSMISFLA
jgi:hypothetical protein